MLFEKTSIIISKFSIFLSKFMDTLLWFLECFFHILLIYKWLLIIFVMKRRRYRRHYLTCFSSSCIVVKFRYWISFCMYNTTISSTLISCRIKRTSRLCSIPTCVFNTVSFSMFHWILQIFTILSTRRYLFCIIIFYSIFVKIIFISILMCLVFFGL